jgi:hypothetical protein
MPVSRSRRSGRHAARLGAIIQRASHLPVAIRFALRLLAAWGGVAEALEAAARNRPAQDGSWIAVVQPVMASARAKLDDVVFNPGRRWLVLLVAANVAIYRALAFIVPSAIRP